MLKYRIRWIYHQSFEQIMLVIVVWDSLMMQKSDLKNQRSIKSLHRLDFLGLALAWSKDKNFNLCSTRPEREIEISAQAQPTPKQNTKFGLGPDTTNFFLISAGTTEGILKPVHSVACT